GRPRRLFLSLRAAGRIPEGWDAVTGQRGAMPGWQTRAGRTTLPLTLAANGSIFIVLREKAEERGQPASEAGTIDRVRLKGPWAVRFGARKLRMDTLADWSLSKDSAVRYYSGAAVYEKDFEWTGDVSPKASVDLGQVADLARVELNGVDCGVVWTPPFRAEIGKALRKGRNVLRVTV